MSTHIQAIQPNASVEQITLSTLPDACPQCHNKITPERGQAFINRRSNQTQRMVEGVFRCPNDECREIFLGYYSQSANPDLFNLEKIVPMNHLPTIFSDTIQAISTDFTKIYDQAGQAEELGLDQICGVGYRRALEFLIKDYLLAKTSEEEQKEKIRGEFLGTAISTRITDSNIKGVAKRAVWLGNDEAHYIRKWEQKDLKDLKKLIALTAHWMDAEALTDQLYKDMPDISESTTK
jgi:hypothetical protein